ncbi:MAG TPA: flagellar biosynthesis anti-sigma factor FlgM [Dongiaceae bacterium]|nr:flagellar biosynthesis anti-sigma factor FlgM [Dongiaceae bacterium]
MKIDPKVQFPNHPATEQIATRKAATSSTKATNAGVSSPAGEDTVSLSAVHSEAQHLAAAIQQVPEVRSSRVDALQQRVRTGQYTPDHQQVADALIAEQTRNAKS